MTTHRRIITTAAISLTLGVGATPASAFINTYGSGGRGFSSPSPSTIVRPNPDQQVPAAASPTIVHVSAPSNGFDWGDAGVGAAGGFVLSMLGLGGALIVSAQRSRRATA